MELVDIVNENGKYLRTQVRDDILNVNEYIKSVHIYLVTNNKEIYIQQRSESKEENPNYWEVAGGGVRTRESVVKAALREIKEEAGIHLKKKDLTLIGTIICGRYLVNAFVAFIDENSKLSAQYEEVKNSLFVSFAEILHLIDSDRFYSSSFGLFQKYYLEQINEQI